MSCINIVESREGYIWMLARVRTLHLRVVSLCYAVALHSLYTQLPGLYGDHGLAPASLALKQMAEAAPESGSGGV